MGGGAERSLRGLPSPERTRRGLRARVPAVRAPAARAAPRPAPPSGSRRPSFPCSRVAARTRARELGRGRAGAAGLAPEVGAEREAGRRGGRADGLGVVVGRGRPGFGAWVPGARARTVIPASSHPPLRGHHAPLAARGLLTPLALCHLCTCPLGPVLPFALQTGHPPSLTSLGPSTKLDSFLQTHSSLFVVCTLVISTLHPLHHPIR